MIHSSNKLALLIGRWSEYSSTQLYTHNSCKLKMTLAIDPGTGRVSTASVLQAKNKKRPTKWVRPISQRGKDVRIIGWKKKRKKGVMA